MNVSCHRTKPGILRVLVSANIEFAASIPLGSKLEKKLCEIIVSLLRTYFFYTL